MAHNLYYLIVDVILVLLQLTVIVCDSSSSCLPALPYTIYLIISWDPVYLSLSSYFVMISTVPVIVQLKINLTLTISIAVERTLAIYFPVVFRSLSSHSYALCSLSSGFLLAILDLTLEFSLTPFMHAPNCPSVGCFLADSFRYYWGISNMVMGIAVIALMTLILMKLRALQQKPEPLGIVKPRNDRFKQLLRNIANRRSVGIFLISLVFVTLPSVGAGLAKAIGFHVFNVVGPFYIAGLLCSGACNSVLHLALDKDMQEVAKKLATCKIMSFSTTVTTNNVFSTVGR